MPKLIFEDDSGEQHELKLNNLPTKSLTKGDVIITYYEVGVIANREVTRALEQLKRLLESVMPDGVKVIVIATRNGKKDVSINIIKNKVLENPQNGV